VFDGAQERIARARRRLEELSAEVDAYLRSAPVEARIEEGPLRDQHLARVTRFVPPPRALGVTSGEVVQHLRSALDYAVGELVELGTGNRPNESDKFEFPVFLDEAKYRGASRKLRGVPPVYERVIEECQPYNASDPEHTTFWFLHRLNIEDKHRGLHVVGAGSVAWTIKHTGKGGPASFRIEPPWTQQRVMTLEVGEVVFEYFSEAASGDVELEVRVSTYFSEPEIVRGYPALHLLGNLIEQVEDTIRLLREAAASGRSGA